jgi:hypothetical protein
MNEGNIESIQSESESELTIPSHFVDVLLKSFEDFPFSMTLLALKSYGVPVDVILRA